MKKISYLSLVAMFVAVSFAACDKVEGPYYNIVSNENVTVSFPDIDPASVYRKVLIEEFTGHRCTNCPAGHQILEQLHQRYGDTLVAVGVHYGALAKPSGTMFSYDFRTEPGTKLGDAYNIDAIPKAIVNREMKEGGWSREQWANVVGEVDRSDVKAALQIINEYDPASMSLKVNTKVTLLQNHEGPLSLVIYLLEDGIVKPQKDGAENIENYTHNHVLRASLTDVFGLSLNDNSQLWDEDDTVLYATRLDCKNTDWVMGNCQVVAVLLDPFASEVLQVEKVPVIQ
ncbi:MAG: Omp28 family outer membrane lipoprotein [Bacteroidales bacterium]|nr:Omp28 family outer membrane lipoprotein [Bacteroidales bacterium]